MTSIAGGVPGAGSSSHPAVSAHPTLLQAHAPGTDPDPAQDHAPGIDPDPAQDYALGAGAGESARLRRQSEELRPEAEALLAGIGLEPGHAAIDLGCGPAGILELLCRAVGSQGRVVGLDADPAHVAMAAEHAARRGLANVEVLAADARHTRLPGGSFDLVHARTLLVTIPEPGGVLAEMVRLARPGGWVASQEPDCELALCYPPLNAWDRLQEIFWASFGRSGADPFIGRRLAELYRQEGLEEIGVMVHASAYPAGHSRRTVIPDLARSLHPVIVELGLASERELAELDRAVREHLADPRTLVVPHLLVAVRGRKPSQASAS
jgi:ubiquinone/menaquinone biosynthesis C-methylase UbiE